jgi:hypothetical protein
VARYGVTPRSAIQPFVDASTDDEGGDEHQSDDGGQGVEHGALLNAVILAQRATSAKVER